MTTLYLPGWATLPTLFPNYHDANTVHLPGPMMSYYPEFFDAIAEPLHVVGFSLGCYLAQDFFRAHPSKVLSMTFHGARPQYPDSDVQGVRKAVSQTPSRTRAYLTQFYKACFTNPIEHALFKTTLEASFLDTFTQPLLEEGLDYIATSKLDGGLLQQVPNLSICHGQEDAIAPFFETENFCTEFSLPFFPHPGGHSIPT
ncbi:MAG: alpha/beta fold hydrolase [Candidatus Margulisiibacteriota bacterium]